VFNVSYVLNACYILGEFANNLPDYQKIEIMVFVMGKVHLPSENSQR